MRLLRRLSWTGLATAPAIKAETRTAVLKSFPNILFCIYERKCERPAKGLKGLYKLSQVRTHSSRPKTSRHNPPARKEFWNSKKMLWSAEKTQGHLARKEKRRRKIGKRERMRTISRVPSLLYAKDDLSVMSKTVVSARPKAQKYSFVTGSTEQIAAPSHKRHPIMRKSWIPTSIDDARRDVRVFIALCQDKRCPIH